MLLENWRYYVDMGPGRDFWVLSGNVYDHPRFENGDFVHTSTPISFDEARMEVTTRSGSVYKLGQCAGNLEEQKNYIKEDVARGGSFVV